MLPMSTSASARALFVSEDLASIRLDGIDEDVAEIDGALYRRLDPALYARLRVEMCRASEQHEAGHLTAAAFEVRRARFNAIYRFARWNLDAAELTAAVKGFDESGAAPPEESSCGARVVMSPRRRTWPTSNESRAELWTSFLDRFAAALGVPAVRPGRRNFVAWRTGHEVHHLQLVRLAGPSAADPTAPHLTRIAIDHFEFRASKELLDRLGLGDVETRTRMVDGDRPLHLEFSVLGDELLAFADWLPVWIRGRLDPRLPISLPPVPSNVYGPGLRRTVYAWTAEAWRANAAWKRHSPALSWYAIPAEELEPEPAAWDAVAHVVDAAFAGSAR